MKALKNSEITALLGSTPETGSVKVRFSSPITVTMQPWILAVAAVENNITL